VTKAAAIRITAVPRTGHTNSGLQAMHFAARYNDEVWAIPSYGDELPSDQPIRFYALDRERPRRFFSPRFIRRTALLWVLLRMLFRRSRFYIIHNVLFAAPAYLLGCRYSIFVHGVDRQHLDTRWGRAVARGATDIFGVGFGVDEQDLTVREVPNIFIPAVLADAPPVQHDMIFVLRNAPVKNPLYPVELAEKVPGLDIVVVGVSEDELPDDHRQRLGRLQANGEKIAYVGRKPYEEVVGLMHASRSLMIPSFSEGIPKVLLEAMSLGMHVIANRCLTFPHTLNDCVERVELDDWQAIRGIAESQRKSARSEKNRRLAADYLEESQRALIGAYDDLYRRQLGFVPSLDKRAAAAA